MTEASGVNTQDDNIAAFCMCPKGMTGTVADDGTGTCTDCESGTFKAAPGNASCINCVAGKFGSTTGLFMCMDCHADRVQSTDRTSCICKAGMYGADSNDACTQCEGGKVKVANGNLVGDCILCANAEHFASADGASCVASCDAGQVTVITTSNGKYCAVSCPAGFRNDGTGNCIACSGANQYQDVVGQAACKTCAGETMGFGQIQTASGTANTACGCGIGYTQALAGAAKDGSGHVCEKCAVDGVNKDYQDQVAQETCKTCSAVGAVRVLANGSLAESGDAAVACSCDVGMSGTIDNSGSGTCTDCVIGKYRNSYGWSVAVSGTEMTCTACAIGEFQDVQGQTACKVCDPTTKHRTTAAVGTSNPLECVCKAGKFGPAANADGTGTCTNCEQGKFKILIGNGVNSQSDCNACHADRSTASTGAESAASCECKQGLYGSSGDNAACSGSCEVGKYKDSVGDAAESCLSCEATRTTEAVGAVNAYLCKCKAGYFGANAGDVNIACTACDIGSFKTAVGDGSNNSQADCTQCHADRSTVATSSTSVADCICKPGKRGLAASGTTDGCTACTTGTWKSALANEECATCHADRATTGTGSTAGTDCLCKKGHYGAASDNGDTACTACEVGTFKDTIGSSESGCKACNADRTTTGTASTAGNECVCNPGFFGPMAATDGQATCTGCTAGKFKTDAGNGVNVETSDCTSCVHGKYGDAIGLNACKNCDEASFTKDLGMTECSTCKMSVGMGFAPYLSVQTVVASDKASCLCPAGTVQESGSAKDGSMHNCAGCTHTTYSPVAGRTSIEGCSSCAGSGRARKNAAGEKASEDENGVLLLP